MNTDVVVFCKSMLEGFRERGEIKTLSGYQHFQKVQRECEKMIADESKEIDSEIKQAQQKLDLLLAQKNDIIAPLNEVKATAYKIMNRYNVTVVDSAKKREVNETKTHTKKG